MLRLLDLALGAFLNVSVSSCMLLVNSWKGGARYRLLQSRRWLATAGQRQFIQWFYCLQTTHSALLSDSAVGVIRKYLMFAIKSILSLYVVC